LRRAIRFDFFQLSASKASPIDTGIVIIIIIVIGEADSGFHNGGIIAQSYFSNADSVGIARITIYFPD
jgi:hypothetical protein